MPGLIRKILVFAAVDGLVLQPASPRSHRPSTEQAIKISYHSNTIAPLLKGRHDEPTTSPAYEIHGVIGLLQISSISYLLTISRRKQVAQIRGKPIYVVTDVGLIPLASQHEAEKALDQARQKHVRTGWEVESDSDTSSDDDDEDVRSLTDVESLPDASEDSATHKRNTSVAEDVINKRGMYGRFAERWFSTKGWSVEGRRKQGMSAEEHPNASKNLSLGLSGAESGSRGTSPASDFTKRGSGPTAKPSDQSVTERVGQAIEDTDSNTLALLPRVLRTAKVFFASKSFYFSYDYDLSRHLAQQKGSGQGLNLHNSFDPLFFWNENLLKPFSEAGQQTFTMPLIQGFVGQRAFALDASEGSTRGNILDVRSRPQDVIEIQGSESDPIPPSGLKPGQEQFLLTIISRRSIKRAGLRYLRRGVDEDGNAANSVETEQILSTPFWGVDGSKIYSYLQCRGSIPVFFSQTPYSFKPIPIFSGSDESNAKAFKIHFQKLATRYGDIQAASLVDKHGTEMSIGEAYQNRAYKINQQGGIDDHGKQLDFEWFDFHRVCAGMKFQNVSKLIDILRPGLDKSGWALEQDGELKKNQKGILRTNCMDCLDRTNVVQSAAGRNALEQQLAEQGFSIDLQTDPTTSWFNSVWADNGDAISREYAGTAALKGDYTRTRKRNISGALTDFGLTLTRYYNNIVNDYLAQTFIDYALGNTDESIFAEFEADMKGQDYAVDLRKVRQNAIDTCTKIVIENEQEDLVAGWTLNCPQIPNTLRTLPFEECVLLLSDTAIYFCRFDWSTEKVREFERVRLELLQEIVMGTYITSTLAKRDVDVQKNVGFLLKYIGEGARVHRINTRSLAASEAEGVSAPSTQPQTPAPHDPGNASFTNLKVLAFKALPSKSNTAMGEKQDAKRIGETDVVEKICNEVMQVANKTRTSDASDITKPIEIENKDIISVAEARKSTGYLEQIGYSLKRLVWA